MYLDTVILAAGQGTRMRSEKPKILHRLAGKPLLTHVYDLARQLPNNRIHIIYGHGAERVRAELASLEAEWIEQAQQLGTGHAVLQAYDALRDVAWVLILYGDVPLLRSTTVERLLDAARQSSGLALLTVNVPQPTGYGRIVRDSEGAICRIVEEKDATPEEKRLSEINTGIMVARGDLLKNWLRRLDNRNAQGEYYLTDIVELAVADGHRVTSVQPAEISEVLGINDKVQLAELERLYQRQCAEALMRRGVTLRDPARFDLRGELVALGTDVEIDVDVILEGNIHLGDRVCIGAHCVIRDARLGDDVEILPHSVIEDAVVGHGCRIGPFARIRPGTDLGEHVHIGNFVEIKNATVAQSSKINHLSYVGDSIVGRHVNIGAGTITCNYDGANKHKTIIEDGAFIGSDTQLVAPVTVGKNATIGAGSTITRDAPPEQLTLSRVKQQSVPGWQRPKKQSSGEHS